MADRNGGPAAGTTRVTLAFNAAGDARGDRLLRAVREAVAGEFAVHGELGRGANGAVVYLASDVAAKRLVALRFTAGERTTRDAGELWLEVLRLDAGKVACPKCGEPLRTWGRFCSRCSADVSGVPAGPPAGGTPAELMRAVREAARGRFEVLGEMSGAEGDGALFFAKDLKDPNDERITALRLQQKEGAAGKHAGYRLGRTEFPASVRDLFGGAPAAGEPEPAAPVVNLETALQNAAPPAGNRPPPRAAPPPGPASDQRPRSDRLPVGVLATVAGIILLGVAAVAWPRPRGETPDADRARADTLAGLLAASASDSAELHIGTALPPNARITVDGVEVTDTLVRVAAGQHTVRASAPGRPPVTRQLTLKSGQVERWTPTFAGAGSRGRSAAGTDGEGARAAGADPASPAGGRTRSGAVATTCASLFANRDWRRALGACEREATQGSTRAQRSAAIIHDRGLGTAQDQTRAAAWYARAAQAGDAISQYRYGVFLRDGRGVRQDEQQAVGWFRRAAEQGDPNAQAALGTALELGTGVRHDGREAVAWYLKAAERGGVTAQLKLADLYERGGSDPQYQAQAARWLRRAAEQGDGGAQYRLARRYAEGRGVPQSDVEAAAWLRKAAAAGNRNARAELRQRNQ